MPDLNGLMNQVYDPTTQSLRISSAGDTIAFPIESLALVAGARTMVVTNDVPRLQLVDAATTTFAFTFWPPTSWLQMGVGFFWTTATAAGGNVRWRVAIKKTFLFVTNISAAFDADVAANYAVPSVGIVNIPSPDHIVNFALGPGFFGACYTVLISRIGGDAGDTHAGTAELLGVYVRKHPV